MQIIAAPVRARVVWSAGVGRQIRFTDSEIYTVIITAGTVFEYLSRSGARYGVTPPARA